MTPEQQASIDVMLEGAGFVDPDSAVDRDVAIGAREALGADPCACIWALELSAEPVLD
jgi:hypothetical protein